MSEYIRGWEIMYRLYMADVNTKLDLMMLVVHFSMMKHGFLVLPFRNEIEFYDPKTHGPGKETLPSDWNKYRCNFVLNYVNQNKHYRLRCGTSSELTVFNLIEQGEDPQVSSVLLNVEAEIKTGNEPLDQIPNLEQILMKVEQELILPFLDKNSKEVHTQTEPEKKRKSELPYLKNPERENDPLRRFMERDRINPGAIEIQIYPPLSTHPYMPGGIPTAGGSGMNVGASDLYPRLSRPYIPERIPTAGGGGGMIFNPFHQPNMRPPGFRPTGYVPGARFNPIGVQPPNPLGPFSPRQPGPRQPGPHYQPGFGGPDPDHLPPHGYEDNMFM